MNCEGERRRSNAGPSGQKMAGKNGKDCFCCEVIAEQVDFLAKAKEANADTSETSEPKASKRRSK